jgi:hypothetical protein
MSTRHRNWLSYFEYANEPGRPRIQLRTPYTEENWQHVPKDLDLEDPDPFDLNDFEENSVQLRSPEELDEILDYQREKMEFDQQRERILQYPIRIYVTCFEEFTELK